MMDSRNGNVGLESLPNLLHTRISSPLSPIKSWGISLRPLSSIRHLSFISFPAFSHSSCSLLINRLPCLPSLTLCRPRTDNSPPASGLLERSLLIIPGQNRWISLSPVTWANPGLRLPSIPSLLIPARTRMFSVQLASLLTLVTGGLVQ